MELRHVMRGVEGKGRRREGGRGRWWRGGRRQEERRGRAKEVGKMKVGGGRKVEREEGREDGKCGGKGEKLRGKGQAAKREAVCGERRTTEKTSGESAVHQIAAFTTFAHWPTRKPFMIGSIMFTKQRRRARQGGQGRVSRLV